MNALAARPIASMERSHCDCIRSILNSTARPSQRNASRTITRQWKGSLTVQLKPRLIPHKSQIRKTQSPERDSSGDNSSDSSSNDSDSSSSASDKSSPRKKKTPTPTTAERKPSPTNTRRTQRSPPARLIQLSDLTPATITTAPASDHETAGNNTQVSTDNTKNIRLQTIGKDLDLIASSF